MSTPLKFALIGCGSASLVHLPAWREVPGAQLVAVCDLDLKRAESAAAHREGVNIYADAEKMLNGEELDFVDLTTPVEPRIALVELCAKHKKHVICETPYATSIAEAKTLNTLCRDAGVRVMVHESLRFQPAMRAVKAALSHAEAGKLYHGRISFRGPAAMLTAQPGSETQEHLALQRYGLHLLDLARYFFGDVKGLFAQSQTVNTNLKGEDIATLVLRSASGASCAIDVNFASPVETVPSISMMLECEGGFVELRPDFSLHKNIRGVVESTSLSSGAAPMSTPFPGLPFAWDAHFAATVAIQTHWVDALRANTPPETSGSDNQRSLALLIGAYESARTRQTYTP